jgi:DNA-binding CsgD family transcriptional regulator
MPPIRTPLGSISGNRIHLCELKPYERGRIIGKAEEGATSAKIARDLKCSESAVKYTIRQEVLCNKGTSLVRASRTKSYNDREERNIVRHIRLNPKHTYKQVKDFLHLEYSKTTIKRILKKYGISNWRARKRLELTKEHILK